MTRRMMRLLSHLLGRAGFATQGFETAIDFLASYKTAPCSCLVVNIDMPAMSGIELIKTLRQDPAAPLIIVLTLKTRLRRVVAKRSATGLGIFSPSRSITPN